MNYCSLFLTITHSFQQSLEQAFFTYLTSVSYSAYISPALHFVVIFLFILSLVKYSECKKAFLFFWRQKGVGSISAHIKILHNTLVPYTVSMLGYHSIPPILQYSTFYRRSHWLLGHNRKCLEKHENMSSLHDFSEFCIRLHYIFYNILVIQFCVYPLN